MSKVCCICGREIPDGFPYYCVGHDVYTCGENDCYRTYFWQRILSNYTLNPQRYVSLYDVLYEENDREDTPQCIVEFENGVKRKMGKLDCIALIPEDKRPYFKKVKARVFPLEE